jgi:hypothetical protein
MLKKYSALSGMLMMRLFDVEMAFWRPISDAEDAQRAQTEILTDEQRDDLNRSVLIPLRMMAIDLALDSAIPLLSRMDKKVKAPYLVVDAHKDIVDLWSRIEDQLKERWFLYVSPSLQPYYTQKQLFGNDVESGFPGAIDDIEDAGTCLALGQGTACVMHLMRVMELGLKVLAKSLKIPYTPSWESYLAQIQSKISAKHKTKRVKWKRDEKFYRDMSGDLIAVKQAWRNPSMHIDRGYSKEEAEEIFRAVKTFMCKLAARMDQNGQDVTWLSISP